MSLRDINTAASGRGLKPTATVLDHYVVGKATVLDYVVGKATVLDYVVVNDSMFDPAWLE